MKTFRLIHLDSPVVRKTIMKQCIEKYIDLDDRSGIGMCELILSFIDHNKVLEFEDIDLIFPEINEVKPEKMFDEFFFFDTKTQDGIDQRLDAMKEIVKMLDWKCNKKKRNSRP